MKDLFSDDVRSREKAAAQYRVFAEKVRIPRKFRIDWQQLLGSRNTNDGLEWPEQLAKGARKTQWPEYAFGTANAACLLVMHRPGLEKGAEKVEDLNRVLFIEPIFPVLGGIPHAHNALFWEQYLRYEKPSDKTWRRIHEYLKPAFDGLENPWSQLMTCNINTQHSSYGEVDDASNLQGLDILDHISLLCQPKIVLLCGGDVHTATRYWEPSLDTNIENVAHPSMWHRKSMNLPNGDETADIVRHTLFP